MRIGLIARSDNSGLGVQTRALYHLLKPSRVLLIDSTPFNGREQHHDWYDTAAISYGFPTEEQVRDFLKDLDVAISCEIFYCPNLPAIAREMGVKTVLQPNAELNDYFQLPNLPKPDAFFLPSPWLESETKRLGVPTYLCPPPVDLQIPYRDMPKKQGHLKVLHMAGRIAAYDRNGTRLVKRLPNIKGVKIDIHNQEDHDVPDVGLIYDRGYHILLIPRRYGGLCIPMYEGLSIGMPVIMPDISPNNQVLPKEWLMRPAVGQHVKTKRLIRTHKVTPNELIATLEKWRDMNSTEYFIERVKAIETYNQYTSGWEKWMEYLKKVVG